MTTAAMTSISEGPVRPGRSALPTCAPAGAYLRHGYSRAGETADRRRGRRIVVGVDGSAQSKAALAWAVGEAALTGAEVEAVMAYYWFPMPINDIDYRGLAEQVLDDAIRDVVSSAQPVKVIARVVGGNAARALLDAAVAADMLVVGSRGHNGLTEALLGSVAQHCIHHATCPVVVIRGSQTSQT